MLENYVYTCKNANLKPHCNLSFAGVAQKIRARIICGKISIVNKYFLEKDEKLEVERVSIRRGVLVKSPSHFA